MTPYYRQYQSHIDGENWLPIAGYEDLYEVSNFGRIKHIVSKNCLKERIIKQSIVRKRLMVVTLSKNSISRKFVPGRLVGGAFIPNPNNLPIACHKDDNPFNNVATNLWWGTQSDNIKDCHKKGRASFNLPKMFGKNHPHYGKQMPLGVKIKMANSKKVISDDNILSAINEIKLGGTLREVGGRYSISYTYLSQLVNKTTFRGKNI